jgi:prevent-host-death family protein
MRSVSRNNSVHGTCSSCRGSRSTLQVGRRCGTTHERVEVMKNGRRAAVILSADDYDSLMETLDILSDAEAMVEIRQAEVDGGRLPSLPRNTELHVVQHQADITCRSSMSEASRGDLIAIVPRSCTAQCGGERVSARFGAIPSSPNTRAASLIKVGSTSRARTSWKNASASITSNPSRDQALVMTSISSR